MPDQEPEHPYRRLLVSLCILGLLYPTLVPGRDARSLGTVVWTLGFFGVMYCAMGAMRCGRTNLRVAHAALALAIGLDVVAVVVNSLPVDALDPSWGQLATLAGQVASSGFLVLATGNILRDVALGERVDLDKIWGAVAIYVLLGLTWAHVFGVVGALCPDALVIMGSNPQQIALLMPENLEGLSTRLYFSFVTLTTVGFGDIAPGHPVMRLLATVEAVCGQLYLTILVARLVTLHISHERSKQVAGLE